MDFVMATERRAARFSHPRPMKAIRPVTDLVRRRRADTSAAAQAARVRFTVAGQPTR